MQGAVGTDRKTSAQLGQIERLNLEAVAWAQDVGVVIDQSALLTRQVMLGCPLK